MMRFLAVLCLLGVVGLVVSPCASVAQDATLVEAYGSGVHAYFQGNVSTAEAMFNQAINGGMEDPRVYYFRGLTHLSSGNQTQAESDFERGAELEATNLNQAASVPRALELVQGPNRALLESYRAGARQAALEREQQRLQERYAAMQAANAQALEEMANAAPSMTTPVPVTPPTGSSLIDPFAEPTGPAVVPAPSQAISADSTLPTDPTTEDETDPGTSVSIPSATLPTGMPAAFVPAEDPAAVLGVLQGLFDKLPLGGGSDSSDPFGGGLDSSNPLGSGFDTPDPFGGADDSADPFGGMDDSTNPFGGATEDAAPSGEAADSADPFGGATEDAAPSGGATDSADPFGEATEDAAPSGEATDSSDPFGGATEDAAPSGGAVDSTDPFGGAADSADPFGGAADSADPFGGATEDAAPSGGAADSTNPFGGATDSTDPFGGATDSADPFGGAADSTDPFGGATDSADPFGAPVPTPF